MVVTAIGVVLAIIGITAIVLIVGGEEEAGAAEVFLEEADSAGTDPFTGSVAQGGGAVSPSGPASEGDDGSTTGPTDDATTIRTFPGGEPGLYGGTQDEGTCDKDQLIDFLARNSAKGSAWAGALGIQVGDIDSYVRSLTAVRLISDTRVTNHGFRDGSANPLQSVLQSGTAVLVDRRGVPRVRCSCGNPLAPPQAVSAPRYTGPRWTWFRPSSVTVINVNTTVIDVFVLTDPDTGRTFARPSGTDGSEDEDDPSATSSTTTTRRSTTSTTSRSTTSTTRRTTTTTRPPTTTTTRPTTTTSSSSSFSEQDIVDQFHLIRDVTCAGADYPFEPHISETVSAVQESDGDWRLTVRGTTSSGVQVFIWVVDGVSLEFSPVSELAQEASLYCSSWG